MVKSHYATYERSYLKEAPTPAGKRGKMPAFYRKNARKMPAFFLFHPSLACTHCLARWEGKTKEKKCLLFPAFYQKNACIFLAFFW